MLRGFLPVLLVVAAGCIFDRGGVPPSATGDATDLTLTPEQTVPDLAATDGNATPGDLTHDRGPPDGVAPPDMSPDSTPVVKPITVADLGTAWGKAQVPCVENDGTSTGQSIPIVDGTSPQLFPGATCLQGMAQDTLTWVGGLSSVCIVWDPNACGGEEKPGDSNWDSAGLILRKAALDGQQRLVLEPGAATTDINLVNLEGNGVWQNEFAKPDDSELATTYKQLVNPVAKAKAIIIQLGS